MKNVLPRCRSVLCGLWVCVTSSFKLMEEFDGMGSNDRDVGSERLKDESQVDCFMCAKPRLFNV